MSQNTAQPTSTNGINPLLRVWRGWLKLAEVLGTIPLVVILTVIYWVVMTIMVIPFKLFANPPAKKQSTRPGWIQKEHAINSLAEIQNQG